MSKKLWKCKYCGLETQGYGVYSHQQSCKGHIDERTKVRDAAEAAAKAKEETSIASALNEGASDAARKLIADAKLKGLYTPSRRMRRRFWGRWGVDFETIIDRSDIGPVPPTSENNSVPVHATK